MITPVLRYRDAATAARWLCEAFGFQEHDRAQEVSGHVRYVSLRLGGSFVLVRPVANSVFDDLMVQPESIGGANTQICYLTISDASDHHARAKAAGARVELEPQDDGLGGRFYTCRDLEGHLWSFGTRTYGAAHEAVSAFEPAELSPSHPSAAIAPPNGRTARKAAGRGRLLREIGIATATAALVSGGWSYFDTYAERASRNGATRSVVTAARPHEAAEQLAQERGRRLAAESISRQAETELAELRQALQRATADLKRIGKEEEARRTELQRDHSADKEEARSAPLAAQGRIEELSIQNEPMVSNARPMR
jgi:uncharacterized glyoxalase superfamily protein PhnB